MIPTKKVIDLIKNFKSGNYNEVDSIIRDIIKISESKNEIKFAKEIRQIYSQPTNLIRPSTINKSSDIFEIRESKNSIKDIILSNKNKKNLLDIIDIYKNKKKLFDNNLNFPNKIILFGKPGTGKTLFAYVLAHELKLPIVHVYLDKLMSSYLGETGKNIRNIFDFSNNNECILFLDEIDTIAKKRDDQYELGELKRVVTVLIQNIDSFNKNNLLIAATNHEYLLDSAIWRRFDYALELDLFEKKERTDFIKKEFLDYKKDFIDYDFISDVTYLFTGAEMKRVFDNSKISFLLSKEKFSLNENILFEVLKEMTKRDIRKNNDIVKNFKNIVSYLRKNKDIVLKKIEEITGISDSSIQYILQNK